MSTGSVRRLTPLFLPALLALQLAASPAGAYKKIRFGPFEIVPSFSTEFRHHSNIYVTSEDEKALGNPLADVSGLLIDVRPGVAISSRPDLEKHSRGLYFDFRYTPTMTFWPGAIEFTCEDFGLLPDCDRSKLPKDSFKLDHFLSTGARFQLSPRLSLSGGLDYSEPELSQSDVRITDLAYRGGAKVDLNRRLSVDGQALIKKFETPVDRTSAGALTLVTSLSPFGTFDATELEGRVQFQLQPTLAVGGLYRHDDRNFRGPDPDVPNDLDGDGIPDNNKDYTQHEIQGFVTKRLTRTARGYASAGYITRTQEDRRFGAQNYNHWTASATVETLLSKKTRIQGAAEYTLTDTTRDLTFAELNAFTNDQTGQFAVLPEQFSIAYDQRYVVDLIQNVFRRGDQILFGVAYQRDRLVDQIGSSNAFLPLVPGQSRPDEVPDSECETGPNGEPIFCGSTLNNQIDRKLLFTAGYRMRLYRWLGIQVRGGRYHATAKPEPTDTLSKFRPGYEVTNPDKFDEVETNYWTISGGVVINLQVFH